MAGLALGHIHLRFAWAGHTQLCHTPSFTHIFVTHHLSHHLSHTTLSHTTLSHTIYHTCHRGTWRHAPSFHVACLALGDIYLRFTWQAWHLETSSLAWQAWHLETSTCVWRGRHSTCCTWWRAWSPLVAVGCPVRRVPAFGVASVALVRHLPAFGMAGVALVALGGALGRRWSPLVAWGAAPLCVAGVALGDIYLRFT